MYSIRNTYTKIGTIQRRLAWPLRKDDTQNREAFHIFGVKNTIFFGTLRRYYLETLMPTIQASLAQWQSTSLVGIKVIKVTRGHEFNSHRRHRYVITHDGILMKHLYKTVLILDYLQHRILLSYSQDGRAVQGAAFRSQSSLLGEGSNPSSDTRSWYFYFSFAFVYR